MTQSINAYPEQRAAFEPGAFDRRSVARRISEIDIESLPAPVGAWAHALDVVAEQFNRANARAFKGKIR